MKPTCEKTVRSYEKRKGQPEFLSLFPSVKVNSNSLMVFSSPSPLALTSFKILLISLILALEGGVSVPSTDASLALLAIDLHPSEQKSLTPFSRSDEQMVHLRALATPKPPKRSASSSASSESSLVGLVDLGAMASGSEANDLETRTG